MKNIELPDNMRQKSTDVNIEDLRKYLKQAENRPAIKERLILTMYEITENVKLLYNSDDVAVLDSEDQTGNYLCCINKSDEDINLTLSLPSLGLTKEYTAYCVLNGEDIEVSKKTFKLRIPSLNAILVKMTPVEE